MAKEFAVPFGAEDLAYAAGLLHDVGKCSDQFQDYLQRCRQDMQRGRRGKTKPGGGDHKGAGALLSRQFFEGLKENFVALAVLGHHGEMPAKSEAATRSLVSEEEARLKESIRRAVQSVEEIRLLPAKIPIPEKLCATEADREMFVRMLYSCLVDADSLDTERHFHETQADQRGRCASFAEWQQRLQQRVAVLQQEARQKALEKQSALAEKVCQVREEVSRACLKAAQKPPGAFRLTVPTGGGKTLSSLSFALAHALHQDRPLERIIYAIPYTSIIDQTAQVFCEVLGEDAPLLVHHSALPDESRDKEKDNSNGDGRTSRRRLASQNWDASLIVTTTVQLFDSLFSNRPGRCRKLHNLARSVIILDEVQMLPVGLLEPILSGLRTLIRHYEVTVVFCTATQPAFNVMSKYLRGFKNMVEIIEVEDQQRHFEGLKRVEYKPPQVGEKWRWARVAEEMRRGDATQCLAVVNTRAHALALLKALNDPEAFHLSTLLCGAHRNETPLQRGVVHLHASRGSRSSGRERIETGRGRGDHDRGV